MYHYVKATDVCLWQIYTFTLVISTIAASATIVSSPSLGVFLCKSVLLLSFGVEDSLECGLGVDDPQLESSPSLLSSSLPPLSSSSCPSSPSSSSSSSSSPSFSIYNTLYNNG